MAASLISVHRVAAATSGRLFSASATIKPSQESAPRPPCPSLLLLRAPQDPAPPNAAARAPASSRAQSHLRSVS